MNPREVGTLIAICKAYGYGNVMQMASTLWRMEAERNGEPEIGCFVPTCLPFVKEEYRQMVDDAHEVYKSHVKAYLDHLDEYQMR